MEKIKLKIKNKEEESYDIMIGLDILKDVGSFVDFKKYSKIAVITDNNVVNPWLNKLKQSVGRETLDIILTPGESEKNIITLQKICDNLLKNGFDRKSLVINLGGGVVCDIGGFAASVYMRGIEFIQIPTTLLAQVDASVGGKVGVNFSGIKNCLGQFVQPITVIIDVETLTTLPERELVSGFAEVAKHGLIKDSKYFELVTSKKPSEFSKEELIEIIRQSVKLKAEIVGEDEQEFGLRKILNFGHTIGHAIEELSLQDNISLLHGEAVAIGMIAEAKLSSELGKITKNEFILIEKRLANCGLPIRFKKEVLLSRLLEMMQKDKKNIRGVMKWTLLESIGNASFDNNVSKEIVKEVLHYILCKS